MHIQLIDRIPTGDQYEGYVWLSDAQRPKLYRPGTEFVDNFESSITPYIVEAWLYDAADERSYTIRYNAGIYLRIAHELRGTHKVTYVAHDLGAARQFSIAECWMAEEDPNCAGLEVDRLAWRAFAGFINS